MQEMQEMGVRPLGQEDPLEEGTATHSSILGGEGHKELAMTEATEHIGSLIVINTLH